MQIFRYTTGDKGVHNKKTLIAETPKCTHTKKLHIVSISRAQTEIEWHDMGEKFNLQPEVEHSELRVVSFWEVLRGSHLKKTMEFGAVYW